MKRGECVKAHSLFYGKKRIQREKQKIVHKKEKTFYVRYHKRLCKI